MLIKDQLGNLIAFERPPQRIVSLVPSLSEFLWELGMQNQLKGITKFCIHPKVMYESIEKVGGTKSLDIAKIISFSPDLVLANKEENLKEEVELLASHLPVWVSDISNLVEAFEMMEVVGSITDREKEVKKLVQEINNKKKEHAFDLNWNKPRAAYIIWRKPWMGAGANTFIDKMLHEAGFINCLNYKDRYPLIDIQELKYVNPDVVFLSSEPFPFSDKHIQELDKILGREVCMLVDGEMFSWYGSRMIHAFTYFSELRKSYRKRFIPLL